MDYEKEYVKLGKEKRALNNQWHDLYNEQGKSLRFHKVCYWIAWVVGVVAAMIIFTSPVCAQEHPNSLKPLLRAEVLTRMVLQEANNEPVEGMVAVAGVALDRVVDSRWPSSLEAVIRQPYQFSGMSIALRDYTQREITRARFAVEIATSGQRPCGVVLWFHADYMMPGWARGYIVPACHLGGHIFYKDKEKSDESH